jgi:hypothetical protein
MASGYVFVEVRPSCELFCLPLLLFRLSLLFFRLLTQLRFAFSFFFRALLPLPCLLELFEQGFVVSYAATGHCA